MDVEGQPVETSLLRMFAAQVADEWFHTQCMFLELQRTRECIKLAAYFGPKPYLCPEAKVLENREVVLRDPMQRRMTVGWRRGHFWTAKQKLLPDPETFSGASCIMASGDVKLSEMARVLLAEQKQTIMRPEAYMTLLAPRCGFLPTPADYAREKEVVDGVA